MAMPDPESPAGKVDWLKFFKNVLPLVDVFIPSIDELLYMLRPAKYYRISLKKEKLDITLLDQLAEQLIGYGTNVVAIKSVSYTHLRAHETRHDLVCRLLLEKKK